MPEPLTDGERKLAVEEWKLLAAIIARLEDVEYKIRSWLLALITGLALALYSGKIEFSEYSFATISFLLIVIFAWMDLVHRIPKRNAIERSRTIEDKLRNGGGYDGPRISEELSTPRREGMRDECKRMARNTPYVQIALLVALLFLGYLLTEGLQDARTQNNRPAAEHVGDGT